MRGGERGQTRQRDVLGSHVLLHRRRAKPSSRRLVLSLALCPLTPASALLASTLVFRYLALEVADAPCSNMQRLFLQQGSKSRDDTR